jgi:hypothetical protein
MSEHNQNCDASSPSGAGINPDWAIVSSRPMRDLAPLAWPTEPSFAEMVSDPVFLKLMASDQVSIEALNGLVSAVRRRLG